MDHKDENLDLSESQFGSPRKPRRWTPDRILFLTFLLHLLIAGLALAGLFFLLLSPTLLIYIVAPLVFVVLVTGLYLAYRSSSSPSSIEFIPLSNDEGADPKRRNVADPRGARAEQSPHPKKTLSIGLFGGTQAGKSAFLARYVNNSFTEFYIATIGTDRNSKQLKTTSERPSPSKLSILDTPGEEKFRELVNYGIYSEDGYMVMYDITHPESFTKAKERVDDIRRIKKGGGIGPIMLVGCKLDLVEPNRQGQVTTQEAQDYANSQGLLFIETSAKRGTNVEQAFETLIKRMGPLEPNGFPTAVRI